MSTWEETNTDATSYEVDELDIELESEVLETILKKNSILKFAHDDQIHALMACLRPLPVTANQKVITQGDEDNNTLYIVSKGRCRVECQQKNQHKAIVAELFEGDMFGEEALLTGAPRNATIVASEDSVLLQLDREDFNQFLKATLIQALNIEQCDNKIIHGAQWVDTRKPAAHAENGLGINIPLAAARIHATELDPNLHYILYCDDGRVSQVVATILKQHDIDCFVLEGGLNQYPSGALRELLPLKKEAHGTGNDEVVSPAEHKKEVNHYKDLLIELTINSQKQLRQLKNQHQNEMKRAQQISTTQKPKEKAKSAAPKGLMKKIASLEKMLSVKEDQLKKIKDELNELAVKKIAHSEVVKAFHDIKDDYEQKEREYLTIIDSLKNELTKPTAH